jgi:uridine kinase
MVDMDDVVARILRERAAVSEQRSLLVGVSGIDGSGKGYVAKQMEARLGQHSIAAANINVDGWLNLPGRRFSAIKPAEHFYENAIRFNELFTKLLLPLKDYRSVSVVADFAEEAASHYCKEVYSFKNVDVVLVEGIFLFRREHRKLFDLAIWVDCSFPTALARALARAQERLSPAETIHAYETIYFPAQRIHFARDNPRETAHLIIDNDPEVTRGLRSRNRSLSWEARRENGSRSLMKARSISG